MTDSTRPGVVVAALLVIAVAATCGGAFVWLALAAR